MVHRRTVAAVALSGLLLTAAGCAGDTGTDTATDTATDTDSDTGADTDTAPGGAADQGKAVVAHAEAYGAVVSHPAYLNVQLSEPETVPALVQEVTHGKLRASSNGNVWTFADASGDCATSISPDATGAGVLKTTCAGVDVDEEFSDALSVVLSGRDDAAAVASKVSEAVSAHAATHEMALADIVDSGYLEEVSENEEAKVTFRPKQEGSLVSFAVEVDGFCLQGELDEVAVGNIDSTWEDATQVTKGASVNGVCRAV